MNSLRHSPQYAGFSTVSSFIKFDNLFSLLEPGLKVLQMVLQLTEQPPCLGKSHYKKKTKTTQSPALIPLKWLPSAKELGYAYKIKVPTFLSSFSWMH